MSEQPLTLRIWRSLTRSSVGKTLVWGATLDPVSRSGSFQVGVFKAANQASLATMAQSGGGDWLCLSF